MESKSSAIGPDRHRTCSRGLLACRKSSGARPKSSARRGKSSGADGTSTGSRPGRLLTSPDRLPELLKSLSLGCGGLARSPEGCRRVRAGFRRLPEAAGGPREDFPRVPETSGRFSQSPERVWKRPDRIGKALDSIGKLPERARTCPESLVPCGLSSRKPPGFSWRLRTRLRAAPDSLEELARLTGRTRGSQAARDAFFRD